MYHNEFAANQGGFSAYAMPAKGIRKVRKGFNVIKALEYGLVLLIIAIIVF